MFPKLSGRLGLGDRVGLSPADYLNLSGFAGFCPGPGDKKYDATSATHLLSRPTFRVSGRPRLWLFSCLLWGWVGKTTRAVGLAVRAAGHRCRVAFVQFMKAGTSGERQVFDQIPQVRYFCPGEHPFIMPRGPGRVHFQHAEAALQFALEAAEGNFHFLVCDEILNTLIFNLLPRERLLDLIDRCKNRVDLVFTGRSAPGDILEKADYATEMIQVKHPYYQGARARKGIEY